MKRGLVLAAALAAAVHAQDAPAALQALPRLEVASYMGTWHQVLWIPNRFQKQCVADTTATYRDLGTGSVEVINRCRTADGKIDSVTGVARPPAGVSYIDAGRLQPARLEVSFLPAWLRWTGIGWGAYWVVDLAPDGRYAIVSEASRNYLWVLSRQPALTPNDDATVRARLQALGFDPARVQAHPQSQR
ncbi:MAG TPA: lipocalin family protein [Burkholderiaceae bacterium]|nr:lipocalin family protein [Burkholderiaceae bacterium]